MPTESSGGASSAESNFVPASLTALIPSFDPTVDAVEVWAQKFNYSYKFGPKIR